MAGIERIRPVESTCPKCGKPIPAGSNFCPYCGHPLKAVKRPLGVTLISLWYWLLCITHMLFILYFYGMYSEFLTETLEPLFRSISAIEMELAILSGFPAYGLWKLRPWARMAGVMMALADGVERLIAFASPHSILIIADIAILSYLSKRDIKELFEGAFIPP